jgi:cytochrome P450
MGQSGNKPGCFDLIKAGEKMSEQKFSINNLNVTDAEFRKDPHPVLDKLRSTQPVFYDADAHMTVLTRAADMTQLLNDRSVPCDPRKSRPDSLLRRVFRVDENFRPSLLRMDDPDHKRVRNLVSKAFNQASIDAVRPKIEAIANELLDSLQGRSSFDLIEDFAEPLPITVIAEMLGVDTERRSDFLQWSKAQLNMFNPRPTSEQLDLLKWGRDSFHSYLKEVFEERKQHRGTDLVSAMITAYEEEQQISEWEIISTCELLLLAGNITTTDVIGNGIFALLKHPEQLQKLRANPALMAGTVEEILRYDPPITHVSRVATDSTVVDGCPFHAGDGIYSMLIAANHDPALHQNPHAFDIERESKRHLSFGGGAHFCIGAPLARAEAQIALTLFLERFPVIQLKQGPDPVRKIAPSFNGLESLWLTVP